MLGRKSHEPSVEQWIDRLKPKVAELEKHKEPLRDFVTDDAANTFGWDDAASPLITRRVFVSSTFRDFHAERDLLQRKVAPVLRERCAQHGETFDLVDLRWGVATSDLGPEEAAEKVASVCFKLIDNCEPYFLCLVGERYGWIPEQEVWERALGKEMAGRLAKEALELCGTESLSATSAEVAYGVSHVPKSGRAMRVMGALRDPIKVTCVTDRTSVYVDDGHAEYVHELRDGLRRVCGEDLICYSGRLDEESGRLEDLITDDGENLEDALIKLIEKTFEEDWSRERARGAYDRVWSQNRAFVKSRVDSEYVLHRSELVSQIAERILVNSDSVCVCGGRGKGKTQLLCDLVRWFEDRNDTLVVGYFPEAVSSRLSVNAVFDYLLASIRIGLGQSPMNEIPQIAESRDSAEPKRWSELIENAIQKYQWFPDDTIKNIVVILDSSDGLGGLFEYAANVFKLTRKTFKQRPLVAFQQRFEKSEITLRVVLSLDGANRDVVEGGVEERDLDALTTQEAIELAELELRRNHRDVTEGMHYALNNLGSEKEPMYVILAVRSLELLGGRELSSLGDAAAIEEFVAECCNELPDSLLDLSLSLIRATSTSVGTILPRMLLEALSFLPFGATRETLRSVLERMGCHWSDLDVEVTIGALSPLIDQGQDGYYSITYTPLRKALSQGVRNGKSNYYHNLLVHLANRTLATTDGSMASLANALHLAREANLPNLCMALCHLAVEDRNGNQYFVASALRAAMVAVFAEDEGEWFADAICDSANKATLTWSDLSYLLWFIESAPRTRSSDAVVTNIGFELFRACKLMKDKGMKLKSLEKRETRAHKVYVKASKRSDPDRWSGVISPLKKRSQCEVRLERTGVLKSFIGEAYGWGKFKIGDNIAYDLDVLSDWNPIAAQVMLVGRGDAGLAYILKNGFPYRFILDGGDLDRHITQAAIWWYVDEESISNDYKVNLEDPRNVRPEVEKLVTGAYAAKSRGDETIFMVGKVLIPCVFATNRWSSSLMVSLLDPRELDLELLDAIRLEGTPS